MIGVTNIALDNQGWTEGLASFEERQRLPHGENICGLCAERHAYVQVGSCQHQSEHISKNLHVPNPLGIQANRIETQH